MTPRQENVITENTPGTSTECSPIKKKEVLYWVRILRFLVHGTWTYQCGISVQLLGKLTLFNYYWLLFMHIVGFQNTYNTVDIYSISAGKSATFVPLFLSYF